MIPSPYETFANAQTIQLIQILGSGDEIVYLLQRSKIISANDTAPDGEHANAGQLPGEMTHAPALLNMSRPITLS